MKITSRLLASLTICVAATTLAGTLTMQSPQELSGQLDELLDGVEAIRQTTRDTEQLIGALEREA